MCTVSLPPACRGVATSTTDGGNSSGDSYAYDATALATTSAAAGGAAADDNATAGIAAAAPAAHNAVGEKAGDDDDDDFDELEAAAQEVHDVCMAMLVYVLRVEADTVATLPGCYRRHRLREGVPLCARTLVHHRHHNNNNNDDDDGLEGAVGDGFDSPAQLREATRHFLQLGGKLMVLLQRPLVTRLLRSAAKRRGECRREGVYARHAVLAKAHWRTFASYAGYRHAPFEVAQLRADMSDDVVANTRSLRDAATLRLLFALMRPQHAFRAQLEQRMYDILQAKDDGGGGGSAAPA